MKTIITSSGNQVKSAFDRRFARAAWFCLMDEETGHIRFIQNEFAEATQGASKKAVETVRELGAGKVVSGDFGPRAQELLDQLNVQMVMINDKSLTVADIIDKILNQI